ncbi:MAG: cadherin-like domain-containing protein, partial [Deltaproteobacteria bacterium]|nr:cadherin-like domain-containing protein [Deltaproteobacteria bacterium]
MTDAAPADAAAPDVAQDAGLADTSTPADATVDSLTPDIVPADTSVDTQAPPVAWVDVVSTKAGTPGRFSPLDNDEDPNGDLLSLLSVGTPNHGNVTANTDSSVSYTPAAGFRGIDFFDYRVTDNLAGNDVGAVAVAVDSIESVLEGTGSAGIVRLADDAMLSVHEYYSAARSFRVRKLDAGGTMQWEKSAGGTAAGIDAFADGSFSIAGNFWGSITFDAGLPNELRLDAVQARDIQGFAAHFGADGAVVWARQFGASTTCAGCEYANDVAALSNGTTVVVGTSGWYDDVGYVEAVDGAGVTAWRWRLREDKAEAHSVDALSDDSIVVAITSVNGLRLMRFASDGTVLWTRELEASRSRVRALSDDRILVTGGATMGAVFGANEPNETVVHGYAFLALYQSDGSLVWVTSMRAPSSASATPLAGGDFLWVGSNGIFVNTSQASFTPGFGELVDLMVWSTTSYVARVSPTGVIRYVSRLPLKWWSGKAMAVEQFSDGSVAYGGFVKGLQTFGEGETH